MNSSSVWRLSSSDSADGRNRINLLRGYDQSDIVEMVKDMCSRPLPHGEVE